MDEFSAKPPGWYPVPRQDDRERWWNGEAWTDDTRPRGDATRTDDQGLTAPVPAPATADPSQSPPVAIRTRPGTVGTTTMMVTGVVLFVAGWLVIGTAGDAAMNGSLVDSEIPPLVTKAISGLLVGLLGAVLFGAALVRRHVAAWALWLRDSE